MVVTNLLIFGFDSLYTRKCTQLYLFVLIGTVQKQTVKSVNEFAVSAPIVTIHYQGVYVKRGLCKQTRGVTCIEWLSPVIIRRLGPPAIVNYHIQMTL